MSYVKGRIFLSFSKTQKTALCNFLRALVKKCTNLTVHEIADKFLEDEEYYQKVGNPHFEFLEDFIFDDEFRFEVELYIKECKAYFDYMETQKPIIKAQKEFERNKRRFVQDLKMKREKPTKKQLYYYDRLCKKYDIVKKELSDLSKFDLKTMISEIIDEHSRDS